MAICCSSAGGAALTPIVMMMMPSARAAAAAFSVTWVGLSGPPLGKFGTPSVSNTSTQVTLNAAGPSVMRRHCPPFEKEAL